MHRDLGAVDLGVPSAEDLAVPDVDDLSVGDLSVGDSFVATDEASATLLVEDFCVADLGMPYTRCYVDHQPIDGY